jgi:hypothetical protein
MVAFVNGKFTNASAHTSYLYLVKDLPAQKPAPQPKPFRFSPRRKIQSQNLHPVLGGPPIIYRQLNQRQRSSGQNIVNSWTAGRSSGERSAGKSVHYREWGWRVNPQFNIRRADPTAGRPQSLR